MRRQGIWARLILLIVAVIAAACVAAVLLRTGLSFLKELQPNGAGERDPMFAEEAVQATMPPDLIEEGDIPASGDRSSEWETGIETPVDMTADELGAAARRSDD